jgi:hypothetical protein
MHKNAMKCKKTQSKWCINKHGASKIIDTFETYQNLSRNLYSSFLSVDEQENIIPKTPEAAVVAAQAFLFTTQPTPGDPREHMHRAALQGLGLVGDKLKERDETPCRHEGTRKFQSPNKDKSPHYHNSPRHRIRGRRS